LALQRRCEIDCGPSQAGEAFDKTFGRHRPHYFARQGRGHRFKIARRIGPLPCLRPRQEVPAGHRQVTRTGNR
jgi:hypothetical protein